MAESAEGLFGKTREVVTVVVDRGESIIDNCATLNNVCTSNALIRKTESQSDGDTTTSSYLIESASNSIAKTLEKEAVASLSGLGEGGGGRRPLSVEVDEDGNHHPFLTEFSAGRRQSNIGGASLSVSTNSTSSFSSVSGLNNSTLTATTTTISSEEECNNSLASHSVPQSSGLVSNLTFNSVHNQPQQRTHHQQQKIGNKEKLIIPTDRNHTSNSTQQQPFQNNYQNTDLVHGGVDGGGNSEISYPNSGCVDNNNPKQPVFSTNQSR